MKVLFFIGGLTLFICFTISSCKSPNYIAYYNKANALDSIYKINRDTITYLKQFRKLYKKFNPPKSIEAVSKYQEFIVLSEEKKIKFGGKRTLRKLIVGVAPFNTDHKMLFPLFEKYGMDSVCVKKRINHVRSKMNKQLIDSFSVAFVRDQENERTDMPTLVKNDKKNAKLLKWALENFGYPSIQKIGNHGNGNVFMPMRTFLSHMSSVSDYYPYFKEKLLVYVKSGECPPAEYGTMVDRHERDHNRDVIYGQYSGKFSDTAQVNRNRKSIGLKSLKSKRVKTNN